VQSSNGVVGVVDDAAVRIHSIEAVPFRADREMSSAIGSAGSPSALRAGNTRYRWAENYPVIYSSQFETALIAVTLDSGLKGWGEAQAPVAPEVACAIVDHILAPVMAGEPFDGAIQSIEALWWRMYSTMRVRGQTGGFMLDAIAGIDLALWDLAGQMAGRPVSQLLGGTQRRVKAYLSGLPGGDPENVRPFADAGFDLVKIFHDGDVNGLLRKCDAVRGLVDGIAIDALWRLNSESAIALEPAFLARDARWLEAPLAPESAMEHGRLASLIRTPIAIGESYRTVFELEPFFEAGAMGIVQPDLGRTGITEGLRIARAAEARGITVIPHVSIAMGPQLAAAIHFAASVPNCTMLEFNPSVLEMANRYLAEPLFVEHAHYVVPCEPGLGTAWRSGGPGAF
jgi:galactonate dehydratase